MTKNNTNGLDEALSSLANSIEWCVSPELLSGATVNREKETEAISEAKQAIFQWVNENIIGKDSIDPNERWRYSPEYTAIDDFRINQRNILKSLGFIEGGKK